MKAENDRLEVDFESKFFLFISHSRQIFAEKNIFLIFHVISKERERERGEEIFCRRRKIGNLSVLEFSF